MENKKYISDPGVKWMDFINLNIEIVGVLVSFIMPGYIIQSIYSKFVYDDEEFSINSFLRYFTNSIISNVLVVSLYGLYYFIFGIKISYLFYYIFFISTLLCFPFFFGFIAGLVGSRRSVHRLLNKFNLNPILSVPSAWDSKFLEIGPRWVAIKLADGETIAGLLGKNSYISSTSKERDIYLEQSYYLDVATGKWEYKEDTDGVLVKGEFIKYIEIWLYDPNIRKEDGK